MHVPIIIRIINYKLLDLLRILIVVFMLQGTVVATAWVIRVMQKYGWLQQANFYLYHMATRCGGRRFNALESLPRSHMPSNAKTCDIAGTYEGVNFENE